MLALSSSCATRKQVNDLKAENARLSVKLDSIVASLKDGDSDGVPNFMDKELNSMPGTEVNGFGQMIDLNSNGVSDHIERYLDAMIGIKLGSSPAETTKSTNKNSAISFFQRLIPSSKVSLKQYFNDAYTLDQCRKKIENVVVSKLNVEPENYKYFAINGDSFGIVTANECISKDGKPFKGAGCIQETCKFSNFFCVHQGYSLLFVFLVVKKEVGNQFIDISQSALMDMYENDALSNNPFQNEQLASLFSDPSKKLTKEYNVVVKHIEFFKESKFGEPRIIQSTYNFKSKIKTFFKS
ncbi:MAG: hypothetical protein CFE24_02210 [Flavobacterium sp. BFFFF2]|nr:MAG: hypothetical protein CFE24_02210 [Flavobacterium sp. BFFFF2]